jgi:hypothetical protein
LKNRLEVRDAHKGQFVRDGEPRTVRRFYYLALSNGYITVDMTDTAAGKKSRATAYKIVGAKLVSLRLRGLLAWEAVIDLTRDLDQWQTYNSPQEARAEMRQNYDEDRWRGQTFYPVLIVEKDTMEPICRPLASAWQMPFASSRGYSSPKLQRDVAQLLLSRAEPAFVLFISDLDPSGLDLQRVWGAAFDHFGVAHEIVRLGLTLEQVEEHGLDRFAIEVKPSDARSAAFTAGYGDRCWEVDVLPTEVISSATDAEIEQRIDSKQWQRRAGEIKRARKLL